MATAPVVVTWDRTPGAGHRVTSLAGFTAVALAPEGDRTSWRWFLAGPPYRSLRLADPGRPHGDASDPHEAVSAASRALAVATGLQLAAPHPASCYPCKGTGYLIGWGAEPGKVPCPADVTSEG